MRIVMLLAYALTLKTHSSRNTIFLSISLAHIIDKERFGGIEANFDDLDHTVAAESVFSYSDTIVAVAKFSLK